MHRWSILLTSLLLGACASNYNWGWYAVMPTNKQGLTNTQFLLGGLGTTVALSVLAIVLSVIIGLLVALPGLSNNRLGRSFNRIYVEVFRAIPILVMLLWVYYGLPVLINLNLKISEMRLMRIPK